MCCLLSLFKIYIIICKFFVVEFSYNNLCMAIWFRNWLVICVGLDFVMSKLTSFSILFYYTLVWGRKGSTEICFFVFVSFPFFVEALLNYILSDTLFVLSHFSVHWWELFFSLHEFDCGGLISYNDSRSCFSNIVRLEFDAAFYTTIVVLKRKKKRWSI